MTPELDTNFRFPLVAEGDSSGQELVDGIVYTPEPTPRRFHASKAFVRGIMGCIGSGKTVACCAEIFIRACKQEPFRDKRRSRWGIVRNSYPELKSTTIKTWLDWFEDYTEMKYGSPIEGYCEFNHPDNDGTVVMLELVFIALDLPKDVKKLKSLELTGIFFNEASEIRKVILDMGTGRVGRYPSKQQGGPAWSGVIMDTNAPDDLHWWYKAAEEGEYGSTDTEGSGNDRWEFFRQPPAIVLLEDGRYAFNPKCENISNQPLGANYWIRQVKNKTPEWIKVFLTGDYGSIVDGKPVYAAQWSDSLHLAAVPLLPIKYKEIILGFDFGLWPSCVVAQISTRGHLKILEEIIGEDMGIKQFIENAVKPTLAARYQHNPYIAIGDPAGANRTENEAISVIDTAKSVGLIIQPSPDMSNGITKRLESVRHFLTRLVDGKPTLQLSPTCKVLKKGFNGGYQYKKLQVSGDDRYQPKPLKDMYSHCFDGDTLISTPGRSIKIKDIVNGDIVCTPLGPLPVISVMSRYAWETIEVSLSSGVTIKVTPQHGFAVQRGGFAPADTLMKKGNKIVNINTYAADKWADMQFTQSRYSSGVGAARDTGKVHQFVTGINISGSAQVYDLTVEKAHCYFAEGVLVSNCHDALQYLCVYLTQGLALKAGHQGGARILVDDAPAIGRTGV